MPSVVHRFVYKHFNIIPRNHFVNRTQIYSNDNGSFPFYVEFLLFSSITDKSCTNSWNSIHNPSFWSILNFQNRLSNYRSKWFSTYYKWLMWYLLPFLILSSDLLIIFANKTTNSIYLNDICEIRNWETSLRFYLAKTYLQCAIPGFN